MRNWKNNFKKKNTDRSSDPPPHSNRENKIFRDETIPPITFWLKMYAINDDFSL